MHVSSTTQLLQKIHHKLIHQMQHSASTWQAKKPVQQLLSCFGRGTKIKTSPEEGML